MKINGFAHCTYLVAYETHCADVCLNLVRLTDDLYFMESFRCTFHIFIMEHLLILFLWPCNIQMCRLLRGNCHIFIYFFLMYDNVYNFSDYIVCCHCDDIQAKFGTFEGNLKHLKLMTQTADSVAVNEWNTRVATFTCQFRQKVCNGVHQSFTA